MSMHRITSVVLGVPDVASVSSFYREFGLEDLGDGRFGTIDGGEQLRLVHSPVRRLLQYGVGVEDPDDIARAASRLRSMDIEHRATDDRLAVDDEGSGVKVVLTIAPQYAAQDTPTPPMNGPGHVVRTNVRAEGSVRTGAVRPRKLGHVVLGSTDVERTERLIIDGLGFKVSDTVKHAGKFVRCSTDHHNLMVASAPMKFLHHTSWQVDDIDDVGRGAADMLEADPARHVWGLGRHNIGGNFFWYLRDPAGNFAEYYSDLDVIDDDEAWDPGVFGGRKSLCSWGPEAPPSFLKPEDLGALMMGQHA